MIDCRKHARSLKAEFHYAIWFEARRSYSFEPVCD